MPTTIHTRQQADDALAEACVLIDAVRAFLASKDHSSSRELRDTLDDLQAVRDAID